MSAHAPSSLFALLNPAQAEAASHIDGPMLVLAGPGSGKTRVIVHRIAHLIEQGVPPRQIAALTFTNKAAEELKARVQRLAPDSPVWTSTFHRFCARLLRQYAAHVGLGENYTIYDTSDSRAALKRALEEARIDAQHFTPDRIAHGISWAKNNLILPDQYVPRGGNALGAVVARAYPVYQARLLASNAVDFDDLLLHIATLLKENPETRSSLDSRYRYMMVDEYQDTNLAQYTIVRALSVDHPNLAVTGDPDQSIYGWRGANLQNILDFEHDFPSVRVVKLERNYRSTKRILAVADALIRCNTRRKDKELYTENDEGAKVRLCVRPTQAEEAAMIADRIAHEIAAGRRKANDFAIFYRMNALSRAIEFALRQRGVPFQMVHGVEFFQRQEIKDVVAYLQLLNNPRDDVAFLRVVNTPPRGIGKSTIKRIADHAADRKLSLLNASREAGLIDGLNKRAAVAAAKFVGLFDRLSLTAAGLLEDILGHVLTETKYREIYQDSDDEDDLDRLANIEELLTAARQFDEYHPEGMALEAFLEQSSLVNDTDDWSGESDRVTLMTLHASKGLEFPVVFIVAAEQGILPHERSSNDLNSLEEERRLLFVGMTRAREELELSYASYRAFRGINSLTIPSQFLMELPRGEMSLVTPPRAAPASVMAALEHSSESMGEGPPGDGEELFEHPQPDELSADDISFDVSEFSKPAGANSAAPPESTSPVGKVVPLALGLTTADKLHDNAAGPTTVAEVPVAPDAFELGMVVRHPDYGIGKIVSLSGSGIRRTASVAFAAAAGEKRFMLGKSPLRPAKSRD